MKQHRILYVCSGNIYRSRYAEAYTNHLAATRKLPVAASSRGLTVHLVEECTSPHVLERLSERGIPESCMADCKQALTEADLDAADLVVALKQDEHRPMFAEQFPRWVERVRYWHVNDVGEWTPRTALDTIESLVNELLDEFA